ncbi:hypothetical protein BKA62DRAFT_667408 [Auriculariales sp. MPI-PUGE-AT-0066]|nr:hypothetical protein BKA62DRAFT_667408 [Auriculariales sp. MPI-PUGE-AT-0066]
MSKLQLRKHLEILDSIPLFVIPAILPLSPPIPDSDNAPTPVTPLLKVGLLDDRSRKACPPPNDPMFQRFTVVKRMADRLGAFLMALQSRKLNADAQHSLKGLRQRDGTSPPSAGSPPGQSPGSAASGLNPKTLDIISRALSYSQKSTDRIAQGNEDPQLRPQALAQTFPRTCKRVSAADGHAFRELVPRKGAQEDFALELDP